MNKAFITTALFFVSMSYQSLWAQSQEELAKAAQNPVANMISLPFQNNLNTGIGLDDATQNIMNIQPVWPISLNDEWNLITKPLCPLSLNRAYLQVREGSMA